MKLLPRLSLLASLVFSSAIPASAAGREIKPVTPGALPEVHELLKVLYAISGKSTLTGQHNYPAIKDRNSVFAADFIGRTPAVFSTDFGFAAAGDTDSYLARPDIVEESIRQHRLGALVTICWHAVPPTADEPITFQPRPGSDPRALASVQGRLLDEQFRDVLTPGTALYEKWCSQVDAIAGFLRQLEAARVPVLWRPYHEMNGSWFWWGGRTGEYSTERLYRQIFDRLVHHHQLKNLLWVWSVDRVSRPGMEHEKFFPGLEYADLLALDVYGNDFAQSYYDSLVRLAEGKPLTLAEVGNPPSPEIFAQQPLWTFYVTWAGMVRNTTPQQYDALLRDPRIVNLDDPAYAGIMSGYRQAIGLPPLSIVPAPADFSGTWEIDADASSFHPRLGASTEPARLEVKLQGDDLAIRSTRILEFAGDQTTEDHLKLDGPETRSESMGSPRASTARRTGNGIVLESTLTPAWGPPGTTLHLTETWQLSRGGRRLTVERVAQAPGGNQAVTLVYHRRRN